MAQETRPGTAGGVAGPASPVAVVRAHRDASAEDLGDDVRALALVARSSGRASVVRQVDGVLVRVTVEAA